MKVLILSASIGAGHMQAAEAIAEQFGIDEKDQIEVVDFMDKKIATLNWLLKKVYLSILGLIPDLYDRIYKIAGVRRFGSITRLIWSTLMYLPFARLLKNFDPDVIICTHPFPEAAAAFWKFLHPKKSNQFKLVAVLTDFSLHEIWIYNEVDFYFVATDQMKEELESHGNYKVFATGIPIRKQFQIDQDEFRIPYSVLIMGGGLGLGAFEETIRSLEKINFKIKINVVTGKNEQLQNKLRSMNSKHELQIFGFVKNISSLMQAADLLISKPGALTLSESFAVGLPILLLPPIPGPEALNAEYAVDHGAAIALNNSEEIIQAIEILNDRVKLSRMSEKAKKISKPFAAEKIINVITSNI
ncbi:MAG: glycosyltransferase [Selenomonadaceae bacterium]|nr:glycosyltransferase [Selenomonadaceae bacterium]